MTTVIEARHPGLGETDVATVDTRRARAVLWWAGIGAFFVALQLYLYLRWVTGPNFRTIGTGPTRVPTWMKVNIRANELVSVVLLVVLFYWCFIRAKRREGKIRWSGLFLIAGVSMYWQDMILNFISPVAVYNSYVLNRGTWYCNMPGWADSRGCTVAEGIVWILPWYAWGLLGGAVLCCYLMRKFKARYPKTGVIGMIGFAIALFVLVDFMEESAFMRLGMYGYPGATKTLTIFQGHYYQFPVFEFVSWGICWGLFGCLRYFRNERGESIAERGVDRVGIGIRGKTIVRCLSLIGLMNVVMLLGYSIPNGLFMGLYGGPWPKDFQARSYFTQGVCGAGTTYACPGPDILLDHNRASTIHLDPNGKLVVPSDRTLPKVVSFEK